MQASPNVALNYFGLKEQPFAATADPAYFFAARDHKECLFRLWTAVDDRQGISVVLGNYGTGKTTLLRKLLTGMRSEPDKYNTAVVASPIPSWTSFSLLEAIVSQFGLAPRERSFVAFMEALNRYLLAKRDRVTTLIVDDAQNLNKRGQLELLRLAQNLETPQHKLLNLVFFAQLEWMPVLRAAPNFLQRVGLTYTLGGFNQRELAGMIRFRIAQAGGDEQAPRFDDGAVKAIHAYSEGSPRLTVTLCRNALLLAAQLRTRTIGQTVVLHTIQKTMLPDEERQSRVASVLQTHTVGNSTPAGPDRPPEQPAAPPVSNKARANRMLMRAARAGLGPDTLREGR
jgi:type II secretory pathway predicted ATPase ExeA